MRGYGYRLSFLGLAGLLVVACAELPKTNSLTVAGLIFQNTTSTPIHDARLRVSKTHGLVSCGVILPHNECSTTFPQRQYQGNPITISWQQAGQSWTAKNIQVQLPAYAIPDRATTAVIMLGENGSVIAKLIQLPAGKAETMSLQPK